MPTIDRITPAPVPADAEQVLVPMRDGVRLAADVYRADTADGRAPVILTRVPYDKDGEYCFLPEIARYFRARGYTVVVQDVRGKFRSEGVPEFGVHEVEDGQDTLTWIAAQPWCTGDIVMWGDSYFGYTAIAAAIGGHPALRAIAPRVTGSQLSTVLDHGDGTRDVEQTARKVYFATHFVDRDTYEWEVDWTARPLRAEFERFFAALGRRSANFDAEFGDGPGFVPPSPKELPAAPPVPALYTIGWFDNCALWSWLDVRALTATPGWADTLHLRVEAIDHENNRLSRSPIRPEDDHTLNPAARSRLLPEYLDPALEFFDAVLGRSSSPVPRLTYEICHGEWRTVPDDVSFPPSGTPSWTFPLAPGGRLLTEASWAPDPHPEGEEAISVHAPEPESQAARLRDPDEEGEAARPHDPAAEDEPVSLHDPDEGGEAVWVHDPANLVPSVSANPFAALHDRPDLAPLADRPDVLRFTGTPVRTPVDLIGWAVARLLLDAPEGANIHARLLDLSPDGTAHLITKGQTHLPTGASASPVIIDLQPIAYRLPPGHTLSLDITSSDYPDYLPESPPTTNPWTTLPTSPTPRRLHLATPTPSTLHIGPQPPNTHRTP
ncbi:CocE/NonD family hydrolase [Actinocorallia sp. API 0066]|uniref:CocE/NonD family hydrolase n=1 Tax=Actinocorallia sp. API 0066 TaxID=2896846 RepID=UPI001E36E869|nr:CocE/NonD family hydrolase [Actinocorallia sp. API 0066]MCD0449742.1 CocE/NonD family hydrolase [Actinocorallia sp. API 0066]